MNKLILLLLTIFLSISIKTNAQINTAKAAYIYTISKYMKWPESYNQGNFVIGIYGKDPVTIELKKIAKTKRYVNRRIQIKEFNSLSSITKVHVIYIPTNKTGQMRSVISQIRKYKTLIIGNHPKAIRYGAGINFVVSGNKLSYEVKSINIIKRDIQVIKKVELMASKVY